MRSIVPEEITKLKQQPGKDLWLVGSLSIAHAFMRYGLIDEFRINVNPVVLGSGKPLFKDIGDRMNLRLLRAKTYECGVVGLRYELDRS